MAIKPRRSRRGDNRAGARSDLRADRWSGHDVFTTGEAAEICNVSQQTIIRCFDGGRLHGFRVPGSRFRRIPRAELVRFMKHNGIPLAALDGGERRVLLLSSDDAFADSLARALAADKRLILRIATSPYDGGVLTAQFAPHLIVVDVDLPQLDPRSVLQRAQGVASAPQAEGAGDPQVLVVGTTLRDDSTDLFGKLGAVACLTKPVDPAGLARRIATIV